MGRGWRGSSGRCVGGRWWIWLRLREENARLRERVERECGKVASFEEENLRLLRLREMESQKEGRGGLKKRCQAWAWTRWSGVTAAPCRRPNCWIHRTLFPHV